MGALAILAVGMLIVIGGVLLLRLHAFLALMLGALVVAALTSPEQLVASRIAAGSVPVVAMAGADGLVVRPGKGRPLVAGENTLLIVGVLAPPALKLLPAPGKASAVAPVMVRVDGPLPAGVDWAHASLAPAALIEQARVESSDSVGTRVAAGFGTTAGSIGIIIALAAIIGECLMHSGAADRIVLSIRRGLGDARAPQGFVVSGFVLCIGMFFDTVFYLLLPLAKTMRRRTGKHWVLYVLCVVAGATMAHALVPPTPGPLLVANELGINMGAMMIGGAVVGLIASTAGYLYAVWADRRWDVPLPDEESAAAPVGEPAPESLPPLLVALAPILLPVVLISSAALLDLRPAGTAQPEWAALLRFWGDRNVALMLAALLALGMLWWYRRQSLKGLGTVVQSALASAGVIILIIAAGGAFGAVLKQAGIAAALTALMPSAKVALLPVAFLITSTIRIAQGSATVAMITTVGIVAPLVAAGDLGYHPLYVALAIGCGSKPIPWMNDSGFWIISRMSGFSELQTLRTASAMMSLMGVVGLLATLLGAWLLPLT